MTTKKKSTGKLTAEEVLADYDGSIESHSPEKIRLALLLSINTLALAVRRELLEVEGDAGRDLPPSDGCIDRVRELASAIATINRELRESCNPKAGR